MRRATLLTKAAKEGDEGIVITGMTPKGKPLYSNSAPKVRSGYYIYPPLIAGLFDLQISMHFVFEI
jgi:hypothetical protein